MKDSKDLYAKDLTLSIAGLAGAALAFLAVALGAFGAHGLQGRVSSPDLDIFQTGARYQMYHALALVFLALCPRGLPRSWIRVAVWAFILGVLLFSGSLYVLVLTGVRTLGAVTPFGGVAFLTGWIALFGAFLRRTDA